MEHAHSPSSGRRCGGVLSGVILFSRNVDSPAQLRRLTRSLQDAAGGSSLISVDQEGGLFDGSRLRLRAKVNRIKDRWRYCDGRRARRQGSSIPSA
jgi:hypothetical protein